VPDPHAAAKQWYKREVVIPINHVIVVHQDIASERPDVVRELGRMIAESRTATPAAVSAFQGGRGVRRHERGAE